MLFLGDEIMTKTVSVLAVAFLAVVALTVAHKAQEKPSITDEATTATPTRAPTLQPKPAPVRKYTDQQLQDWATTDAVYVWNEFDIELGPDHRFNWFEIGVRIEEATEILIPRRGLIETDAKVYKEFFENAFMGIATAEQRAAQSLAAPFHIPL